MNMIMNSQQINHMTFPMKLISRRNCRIRFSQIRGIQAISPKINSKRRGLNLFITINRLNSLKILNKSSIKSSRFVNLSDHLSTAAAIRRSFILLKEGVHRRILHLIRI